MQNKKIIGMQLMGPFTQMDKSTIQGLSFEEYTSLSRYYSHVITPILLRELSSMLAKKEEDLDDLKKKVWPSCC